MSRFKKFIFSITDYDLYHIIKIFGIKITFKKKNRKNKPPKSDIDAIVWWIPFKNLRNAIRNIYYEYKNSFNEINHENKLRQEFLNGRIDEIENHIKDFVDYKIKNNNVQFYYMFNKYKEELLKQKVKNGKKIKVIFLVNYISKFGVETIYYSMLESKIFEPYILVVHPRDNLFEENQIYFKEALENYNIFKERGYRTLFAYNMENMKAINIDDFKPDIVFINNPKMSQLSIFKNMNINLKYLTCYINYSINVVNQDNYHYRNESINTCYKMFAETYYCYKKHMNINGGFNTVLTGYPKLDDYKKDIKECVIPKKIDNGKKIVIYAPHWSIRVSDNLATFHLYHKYFFNLLKKNPNINFVFKPHPDLIYRIIDSKIMDIEYYENYIKEWDNSDNGIYIYDGEYIDLFKKSCCLITDSGSFIAEYLPSENPCIYLINPEKENLIENTFNDLAKPIVNSYYLCYNEEDINKYFNEVIINGNDYMKDKRINLIKDSFINIGSAGKTITEYLSDIFIK